MNREKNLLENLIVATANEFGEIFRKPFATHFNFPPRFTALKFLGEIFARSFAIFAAAAAFFSWRGKLSIQIVTRRTFRDKFRSRLRLFKFFTAEIFFDKIFVVVLNGSLCDSFYARKLLGQKNYRAHRATGDDKI